jgi:succinate-acetate transporter protein
MYTAIGTYCSFWMTVVLVGLQPVVNHCEVFLSGTTEKIIRNYLVFRSIPK